MKIRMTTLSAGPKGVSQPGTLLNVEDAEGQALIAAGAAEQVPDDTPMRGDPKPDEKPDATTEIETTAVEGATETAALEHGKARTKK